MHSTRCDVMYVVCICVFPFLYYVLLEILHVALASTLITLPILIIPVVQSCEDDTNRDGRNDVLHLRVEFSDLGQDVNTVQLLLFFHVQLSVSVLFSTNCSTIVLHQLPASCQHGWLSLPNSYHTKYSPRSDLHGNTVMCALHTSLSVLHEIPLCRIDYSNRTEAS